MNQEKAKAYLERIGYKGQVQKDEKTLNRLIRSHLERVPFENLDVCDLGKIPSLEEEALFEKIVARRRGGYCFELNTLLQALLQALGYTVYPVAVRVLWNREFFPPVSHMALVVPFADRKYLCDVGYGWNLRFRRLQGSGFGCGRHLRIFWWRDFTAESGRGYFSFGISRSVRQIFRC